MKTTYQWLGEHVDLTGVTAKELAERLTAAGLEVGETTKHGDDTAYTFEITSNRPDWLSVRGIARELAAIYDRPVTTPARPSARIDSGRKASASVRVRVEAPELCPRYTARHFTGVRIGPSPDWLKKRLVAIGLEPVNNVVDATNFVLFETGQPLHAFDAALIKNGNIVVRRARENEAIRLIRKDEAARKLGPEMLLIAGEAEPLAVAGVMGGALSAIGPNTTEVVLEAANFAPDSIRATARTLGQSSDSSYRFERGTDPCALDYAAELAAGLICELAGAVQSEGCVDIDNRPAAETRTVTMRYRQYRRLMGVAVEPAEAERILGRLGFDVLSNDDGQIAVAVPSWRAGDVTRECDLIEEVARIVGFGNVPETNSLAVAAVFANPVDEAEGIVRSHLSSLGYSEAVTPPFVSREQGALCGYFARLTPLRIESPVNEKEPFLRNSIAATLAACKKRNEDFGNARITLFEVGKVFGAGGERPDEVSAAGLLADRDVLDVKEDVLSVIAALGCDPGTVVFERFEQALTDPDKTARIILGGAPVGYIGQMSRAAGELFDLKNPPVLAEIELGKLAAFEKGCKKFRPLPKFPSVKRDLAIVLDADRTWAEVLGVIAGVSERHLAKVEFFDRYVGKQVPDGKMSLAFAVELRAADRTLKSEEADLAITAVLDALREKLGATLRN